MTDQGDPQKRIAELERQLAEQKRIAELERQLAEAKGAQANAGQDAVDGFNDNARRLAEALQDGLRTGQPQSPEVEQLREGLTRAAQAAGMSEDQLNEALKNAQVRGGGTIRSQVVYSSSDTSDPVFLAPTGRQNFRQEFTFGDQSGPRRQRRWHRSPGGMVGTIVGGMGLCIGGAAALTAVFPSSALWMSGIICGGSNQLFSNTSNYSYGPGHSGTNVTFQCVTANGARNASFMGILALQTLLIAIVVCAVAALVVLIRRLLRNPSERGNLIALGALAILAGVVAVLVPWLMFKNAFDPIQLASGGNLKIDGNGQSKKVMCNDGHLTVTGRDMTVTVIGHCHQLSVDGVINHVAVDTADVIDTKGSGNVVVFHSGTPQISKNSPANTVQQG